MRRGSYGDLAVVYAEETGIIGTRAQEAQRATERELLTVLTVDSPAEVVAVE